MAPELTVVPGVTPGTTPPFFREDEGRALGAGEAPGGSAVPGAAAPASGGASAAGQPGAEILAYISKLISQQARPQLPRPTPRPTGAYASGSGLLGLGAAINNAIVAHREKNLAEAEGDWSDLMTSLQPYMRDDGSIDPAAAGDKYVMAATDPKKLKKMYKALNQDWLNPKYSPHLEALGTHLGKHQEKQQAATGIRGLFQHLIRGQQQQQQQLTPEQQSGVTGDVLARAPRAAALGGALGGGPDINSVRNIADLEKVVTEARQKYEYHVTSEGVIAVNKTNPMDAHLVRDAETGQQYKGKLMPKEGQIYSQNGIPMGVFHNGLPVMPGDPGWTEQDAKLYSEYKDGMFEKQFLRVDPVIAAEVGQPPLPADFKGGRSSTEYRDALKKWGDAAFKLQLEKAAITGEARARAWNEYRPVQAMDDDGNVFYTTAAKAIAMGMAGAGEGIKLRPREAQIKDIETASAHARDAINGLDKQFSTAQIAKLHYAMTTDDEGLANQELASLASQNLSEGQQDFVIWIRQLNERAMSLRNVAGMGVGAQDLRTAIRAMLPGIRSGSKQMMIKQLDAFDNQVSILKGGIAHPGKTPERRSISLD